MQIQKQSKRELTLYVLFIIFTIFLVYSPTLSYDFSYDDFAQIEKNILVTSNSSFIDQSLKILTSPTVPGDLYRPLVTLSYFFQYRIWGSAPALFHAFNILLHAFVVLGVFGFGCKILHSRNLALVAALVYGLHPVHVEAVASIVGRTEILAALFALVAINLALLEKSKSMLVIVFFTLAVLCKESAYTLVFILPLLTWYFGSPFQLRKTRALYLFFTLLLLSFYLFLLRSEILNIEIFADSKLIHAPSNYYFSENPLLNTELYRRVYPALQFFGKYLFLFFLPVKLQVDYSLPFYTFWQDVFSLQGVFFTTLTILYVSLLFYFRKQSYFFLLLFFGLAFGITLNLLTPIGTVFAERLMYFPSIGLSIFVIAFMNNKLKKSQFYLVTFVFLSFLVIHTYFRIPVWKNNESVFRQALMDNPRSAKTHYMLASYLILKNQSLTEAKQILRQAYRIDPAFIENSRLLVDLAIKEKNWSEAEFWCKEVLRFAPNDLKVKEKLEILLKAKQFGQKNE